MGVVSTVGFKDTEVGQVPNDWQVSKLGEVITYIKGYPFKSAEYCSDGLRVIRVSDTASDRIKDEDPIFVSRKNQSNYKNWALRENDLIITTVGSKPPMYDSMVGKIIRVEKKFENALLNQNANLCT